MSKTRKLSLRVVDRMFIEKFNSKVKQERVVFYLTSSTESGLTCMMPDGCGSCENRGSYLYLRMVTGVCAVPRWDTHTWQGPGREANSSVMVFVTM